MKKIVFTILVMSFALTFGSARVFAVSPEYVFEDGDIGTYVQTEPVMQTIKVNIPEDMVAAVEATGVSVITKSTRHGFWPIYWYTYEYYYYEDQYVDVVVEERILSNDIDSLIFVLQELEGFAKDYGSCPADNINNCVIGYVRGVKKEYVYGDSSSASTFEWFAALGWIDKDFITFVDDHDGSELEIAEYFSAFMPYNSYNYTDYKYAEYEYRNMDLLLDDPINSNSNIDLMHLFASMDGIYNGTYSALYMPNMTSWAGDLQTLATEISKHNINVNLIYDEIDSWNIYQNINEDFCDIIEISDCSFSEEDLLADIDATNIVQGLINGEPSCTSSGFCYFVDDYNTISSAMSGYYNIINSDNSTFSNRYKMFFTTSNMRNGKLTNDNLYDELKKEVYDQVYVKENSNGTFSSKIIILSNWTTKLTYLENNERITADLESRVAAANLFYEYVLYMSSKPYYS